MNQGAINKKTSQYTLPNKAEKSEEYECPDCNKDLILCKGQKSDHILDIKMIKKILVNIILIQLKHKYIKMQNLNLKSLLKQKILK